MSGDPRPCSSCGLPRAECRTPEDPFLSCCTRCAADDGDLHRPAADRLVDVAALAAARAAQACELPFPHAPHVVEITTGDLLGHYPCDGQS